jgi:nucleoside-diphosphate-sugar epimerase
MRTFIITGGNGVIGRRLQKNLRNLGDIKNVCRGNFNSDYIRNLIINATGEVYLIHLAWPTSSRNFQSSLDNTRFLNESIAMLYSIQELNVKIIVAGSISEAGNCKVIEDCVQPNPQNLYAESKCILREFLKIEFANKHIWVRISNTISFYDKPNRLTGSILDSIRNREIQTVIREANNQIDLVHVSDVADAFVFCINYFEDLPNELVVGVGRTVKIESFANCFKSSNLKFQYLEQPISIKTNPMLLKKLGWLPRNISSQQLHDAVMMESQDE